MKKKNIANANVVKDKAIDNVRIITVFNNGELVTTERFLGLCRLEEFRNIFIRALEQLENIGRAEFIVGENHIIIELKFK